MFKSWRGEVGTASPQKLRATLSPQHSHALQASASVACVWWIEKAVI